MTSVQPYPLYIGQVLNLRCFVGRLSGKHPIAFPTQITVKQSGPGNENIIRESMMMEILQSMGGSDH